MELNDYQKAAMTTCLPTNENFSYMFLNLVGEVGEFASKVAKAIRKDKACIINNEFVRSRGIGTMTDEDMDELKKEAGDVLWQLAGLCDVMGWRLEDVARQNLQKLASRKDRQVIDGNGDNR